MKTQLIMLDSPIIVSDEEIRDEDTVTNGVEIFKRNSMSEYSDEYANRYWQKIIAGIEGLPSINWNGLAEEFGWIDVEKLAYKEYKGFGWGKNYQVLLEEGFIDGFKKAQSLNEKRFSLEDIEKSIEMIIELMRNKYTEFRTHKNTVLQSLQQPKVVDIKIDIEVEMEQEFTTGITESGRERKFYGEFKPKITNNSIKILKKL